MSILIPYTSHDIKDLSQTGVYSITNKVNSKFYIGCTGRVGEVLSSSGFYRRWTEHIYLLNKNTHFNSYLQNSWNKYGEMSFEFQIMHSCMPEEVFSFEQIYIDLLSPHFNICLKSNSVSGTRVKESSKDKMRLSFTIVDPQGNTIEAKGLGKFAKAEGLNLSPLSEVLNGSKLHHRGWTKDLESHKLYIKISKEFYDKRGLRYAPSVDRWLVYWNTSEGQKNKRFKEKEEALAFRNSLEKEGFEFKSIVPNLKYKDYIHLIDAKW